jgi:hypothetical protein
MARGTGAIAAGWRDAAHAGHDPDLIPLRDRVDFREPMMHLAMPADPFAAARRGAQSESRAARAFRAERLRRSGCIADTAMRTRRDPASFRPLDAPMSVMSMCRTAQQVRRP